MCHVKSPDFLFLLPVIMAAFHLGQTKSVMRITFDKFDANCDGMLDKNEFAQFCYSMGHYMEGQAFEAAWMVLDSDGNGQVSYEEFCEWWRQDDRWAHLQLNDEELKNLHMVHEYFKYYDTASLGYLNAEQFEACYQYMLQSGFAMKQFSHCMQEIDSDGDGVINYNEFVHWMISMGVLSVSGVTPVQIADVTGGGAVAAAHAALAETETETPAV